MNLLRNGIMGSLLVVYLGGFQEIQPEVKPKNIAILTTKMIKIAPANTLYLNYRSEITQNLYKESDHSIHQLLNFLAAQNDSNYLTLDKVNQGYIKGGLGLRLKLFNPNSEFTSSVISIDYPLLDKVSLLDQNAKVMHSGRGVAYHKKAIPHRNAVFPLVLAPGEQYVHLFVESIDSVALPIRIEYRYDFHERDRKMRLFFGVYYGIILIMLMYNMFLFISIRDPSYLWYVLTLLVLHGFFQISLNGFWSELFESAHLWPPSMTISLIFCIGCLCTILFTRYFLQMKQRLQRLYYITRILIWCFILMIPFCFILNYYVIIHLIIILGVVSVFTLLVAGVVSYSSNFSPARFFLIAWSLLLIGGLMYSFKALGFLPSNVWTEFSWQAGSAIESALLSLALADRFNVLQHENRVAKIQAESLGQEVERSKENLLRQTKGMEQFRDEMLAIQNQNPSLQSLLARILSSLKEILKFDKGFIVIADQNQRTLLQHEGHFPIVLQELLPKQLFNDHMLNLPDDLRDQMSEMIFLGQGQELRFDNAKTSPAYNKIMSAIKYLKRDGFHWVVPLRFKYDIFGYIVLGKRFDQLTYDEQDVLLMETLRYSIALAIRNAILFAQVDASRDQAENRARRLGEYLAQLNETIMHKLPDRSLVYCSTEMSKVYELVERYAPLPQPLLIRGETGTGKELIARLVHDLGSRKDKPFVAVNCAALPASLIESEIFGHEKGSFTGAHTSRHGLVEQAKSGTLFFDEIGEMNSDLQSKLLRLLQERKFQRIGGSKLLDANCRFVFATHRNLEKMQAEGSFREDLFYRISVLQLEIPPLRKRLDDVVVLTDYFLDQYANEMQLPRPKISDEAMHILRNYNWPGNIRELESVILQAMLNANKNDLDTDQLPNSVKKNTGKSVENEMEANQTTINSKMDEYFGIWSYDDFMKENSKQILQSALHLTNGNKQDAAKLLKMKRATFYSKVKELDD